MSEQTTVRVGQVWQHVNCLGDRTEWIVGGRNEKYKGWDATRTDGAAGCLLDACWASGMMTLISDVPAPARDRNGCKAWCGKKYADGGVPFRRREVADGAAYAAMFAYPDDGEVRRFLKDDEPVWCAAACRDAKSPPMPEAKVDDQEVVNCPACPWRGPVGHIHSCAAKAAKPEPAKAPKCIRADKGNHKCEGPVFQRVIGHACDSPVAALYCERAATNWEAMTNPNGRGPGLAMSSLPERLPRPRLAADSWWPEFAEDVR